MLTKATALAVLAFTSATFAAPSNNARAAGAILMDESFPHAIGGAIDIAWKAAKGELTTPPIGYTPTDSASVSTETGASATGISSEAPITTASPSLEERMDPVARMANVPNLMTIRLVNNYGIAISTIHYLNQGFPAPINNPGEGILQNGQSGDTIVPHGWAGNIAVVEYGGGRRISGDESLVEASFIDQGQWGGVKFGIDVSYVNGFSLPITCSCDVGVVTGCNYNLWRMNRCESDPGIGSCHNPQRLDSTNWALPFFAPCQGAAYTFAGDHGGMANGLCGNDLVTCCVGESCPRNPKQR